MLKATIIVSTYNSPNYLRLVLDALRDQDTQNFEVIIADDGSSADTKALIDKVKIDFPQPLKYIWHEDLGYRLASIRNKAVASASGNYLIFIDGDCIPRKNFVRNHIKLAEENYFVAGKRVLLSKSFTEKILNGYVQKIATFTLWHWFRLRLNNSCNRFLSLLSLPDSNSRKIKAKKWQGAKGCNLALWKKDFIAINGFDENYIGWGYEDSDLIIRLIRNGISRKEGSFSVTLLHLWHPENNKSKEQENLIRLKEIEQSNKIKASKGIDQYYHG
jgi:glycosyltransferase involved in cell wall biosynthesis